jgi:hypothetical protein
METCQQENTEINLEEAKEDPKADLIQVEPFKEAEFKELT